MRKSTYFPFVLNPEVRSEAEQLNTIYIKQNHWRTRIDLELIPSEGEWGGWKGKHRLRIASVYVFTFKVTQPPPLAACATEPEVRHRPGL